MSLYFSTQDPKGWPDILTARKLHGDCTIQGCGGRDAVCDKYIYCARPFKSCCSHMILVNTRSSISSVVHTRLERWITVWHCIWFDSILLVWSVLPVTQNRNMFWSLCPDVLFPFLSIATEKKWLCLTHATTVCVSPVLYNIVTTRLWDEVLNNVNTLATLWGVLVSVSPFFCGGWLCFLD